MQWSRRLGGTLVRRSRWRITWYIASQDRSRAAILDPADSAEGFGSRAAPLSDSPRPHAAQNLVRNRPRNPRVIVRRHSVAEQHHLVTNPHALDPTHIDHRKIHRNPPHNPRPPPPYPPPPARLRMGQKNLPLQPIRVSHRKHRQPHRPRRRERRVVPH